MNKFVTKRDPSNPLTPVYKLPSCELRIPSPPKFIRDNIDVSVIFYDQPIILINNFFLNG